jgi:galactose mutarotase-like enzyme
MYGVGNFEEQVVLIDTEARSQAMLAPRRGGMVTSWKLGDVDALYLDVASFVDPTKNVRGGIPVLFPSPGKLAGDTWRGGKLEQHGFARKRPWRVVDKSSGDDGAAATLVLGSDDETRADYPFAFEARYRYTLRANELSVVMRFENLGTETMPFGAGFHPYFAVPAAQKGATRIATQATRAFDNVSKREVPYRLDLTAGEVDLHLLDHGSTESSLSWPGGRIDLQGSAELTHWVIWTLPGKDFVCLEPWSCPGDALNTGDRLIHLAPGDARELSLRMRLTPTPSPG